MSVWERIWIFQSDAGASQLDKLAPNELSGLLTNNLGTVRHLSKFSCLSEGAKFRNSRFKVKGIRNDMSLYQCEKGNVTDLAKKIRKVLEECQSSWNVDQKNLLLKRIKVNCGGVVHKIYLDHKFKWFELQISCI